jgi:sugar O-acyltransferase (sialic acid O-acetyltransferase NeuD family)
LESFDILGFSPGFVCMVIDVLIKCFGRDLNIRIVKNQVCDDNAPFKIDGPAYEEVTHDEWRRDSRNLFIGVGRLLSKKTVFGFFHKKHLIDVNSYSNIVHPGTNISENVIIGHGNFFNFGVSIDSFSVLGNFVTVNRHVGIGHHAKISDFCVLNPGVNIAGFCEIGEDTVIGMGSNIVDGIKIGRNVIIGAGSLVNKNLPDNVVAYGVPAKIVSINDLVGYPPDSGPNRIHH